jgi:opacity protein-like surface antigen
MARSYPRPFLSCLLAVGLGVGVASAAWAQSETPPAQSTPAQSTQAQPPNNVGLGFKGLGARIGFVDPEDASGTLLLGGHIDAGTFVKNVHVLPYVEYWSTGAEAGTVHVDRSDFTVALDVDVDFPMSGQRITPYLGGGLGIHFLSVNTNAPGETNNDDTKAGLNIQGGLRNQFMPNLSLFGEARYTFVSDANSFRILGGFTYNFIY